MPNAKGGKKYKKGGKKNQSSERQLIYKDPKESQEYAKITKVKAPDQIMSFIYNCWLHHDAVKMSNALILLGMVQT